MRITTVANLPPSCTEGQPFVVTDGNSTSDCATGSGSTKVLCTCDAGGSSYTAKGDGSGGTLVVEEADSTVDGAATNLDFGAGFDVTSSPAGEANVVLDYTEDPPNLASEITGTLPVANGGTGATTLTDGGLLLGSGTGAVTALGVATNGQIPIGDGTTDPVLATISGTANEIEITNGVGTITVGIVTSPTLSGATLTGVNDAGGATSFEIPNAANPAAATAGMIALDTTDNQLLVGTGSERVFTQDVKERCGTIENLAAADDDFPFPINSPTGITLVSAYCHCQGTCTTEADISFEYREVGTASTVTAVTGSVTCEDYATGDSATTLSGSTSVPALDVLRFDVDNAVSPETDEYTICVRYRLTGS